MPTALVPVTALYVAAHAVLAVALANNVSRHRRAHNVSLGDGGAPALLRAQRAHGNHAEFVPLALLLLLTAELSRGASGALHAFGVALTAGRFAHAHGLLYDNLRTRVLGTGATWVAILALAGYLLYLRAA